MIKKIFKKFKDQKFVFILLFSMLLISTLMLFFSTIQNMFIAIAYSLIFFSAFFSFKIKHRTYKTIFSLMFGLATFIIPIKLVFSSDVTSVFSDVFTYVILSFSISAISIFSYLNEKMYPTIATLFGIIFWAIVLSIPASFGIQIDKLILVSTMLIVGTYSYIYFIEKANEPKEIATNCVISSVIFSTVLIFLLTFFSIYDRGINFEASLFLEKLFDFVFSIGIIFLLITGFISTVSTLPTTLFLHVFGLKKEIYEGQIQIEKDPNIQMEDEEEEEELQEIKKEKEIDEFKDLIKELKEFKLKKEELDPIYFAEKYSLLKNQFEMLITKGATGNKEEARKLLNEVE